VFLKEHGLDPSKRIVALLPGSRPNEVENLLPILRDAAAHIAARHKAGVQFVIARAPSLDDHLFAGLNWAPVDPVVVLARTDDVLSVADVVIAASGTATVQAALHNCPMVVVYRISPVSYRLVRRLVHVDNAAMVNLIAGRRIVPELIQDECTAESVADEVLSLLREPARVALMRAGLAEVRAKLGGPGASGRAAEAVLQVAHSSSAR
jgi:lipid-A-disaccharide synthase